MVAGNRFTSGPRLLPDRDRWAASSARGPIRSETGENNPATQAAPGAGEQSALNDAFRSAEGNPQILIKNLEAFLTRFPKSSRREVILRTICTYAMQANAPGVAVQYGQALLEMTPDDPKVLALLVDALAGKTTRPAAPAPSTTPRVWSSSRKISALRLPLREQQQYPMGGAHCRHLCPTGRVLSGFRRSRSGFRRL